MVVVSECADESCSIQTSTILGCLGCAIISTTCPLQRPIIQGAYIYLQECYTMTPDGEYWSSCAGRPAYALADHSYFLYYHTDVGEGEGGWAISNKLGSRHVNAYLRDSSAMSLSDLAESGYYWSVWCDEWVTGHLEIQTNLQMNVFETLVSSTGFMKVQFVSADACSMAVMNSGPCTASHFFARFASSLPGIYTLRMCACECQLCHSGVIACVRTCVSTACVCVCLCVHAYYASLYRPIGAYRLHFSCFF